VNRKRRRRPTRSLLGQVNRCKPRRASRNQRPQVIHNHPQ
jgi:hypothetical protein